MIMIMGFKSKCQSALSCKLFDTRGSKFTKTGTYLYKWDGKHANVI